MNQPPGVGLVTLVGAEFLGPAFQALLAQGTQRNGHVVDHLGSEAVNFKQLLEVVDRLGGGPSIQLQSA